MYNKITKWRFYPKVSTCHFHNNIATHTGHSREDEKLVLIYNGIKTCENSNFGRNQTVGSLFEISNTHSVSCPHNTFNHINSCAMKHLIQTKKRWNIHDVSNTLQQRPSMFFSSHQEVLLSTYSLHIKKQYLNMICKRRDWSI